MKGFTGSVAMNTALSVDTVATNKHFQEFVASHKKLVAAEMVAVFVAVTKKSILDDTLIWPLVLDRNLDHSREAAEGS